MGSLERQARYRAAHHDEIVAKHRLYNAAHREERKVATRERRARQGSLAAARSYERQRLYGVTPEQFRDLLVGQAGRCLICLRVPDGQFHIDHDHVTGVVRGLLCGPCNRAIGIFHDDPALLERAIRYLRSAQLRQVA